jgi:hypothetical protein
MPFEGIEYQRAAIRLGWVDFCNVYSQPFLIAGPELACCCSAFVSVLL